MIGTVVIVAVGVILGVTVCVIMHIINRRHNTSMMKLLSQIHCLKRSERIPPLSSGGKRA